MSGEVFREPDAQLGFLIFGTTMGQLLSIPVLIGGSGEKRTLPLIRSGFPDALVTGFDPARVIGTTDTNDRHVASAGARPRHSRSAEPR